MFIVQQFANFKFITMEFQKVIMISVIIIHAVFCANDTINVSHSIRDGETLVSAGGKFELGFFSPQNSTNRYVGIWYNNIPVQKVVWVANREAPLTTNSGVFKVADPGILILVANESATTHTWSSNTSRSVQNPTAQLLESGNLVVKEKADDDEFLWQSFDYPTDTFLSGMSFGLNLQTGGEIYVSAWRSSDDPAPGEYSGHLDPNGYPQLLLKKGTNIQYRFGPWNGVRFSGAAGTRNNPTLTMNKDEVKYKEENVDPTAITQLTVSPNGGGHRWIWSYQSSSWITYSMITDACDTYNICGGNGVCNINESPSCSCLDRFVHNGTVGCVRRTTMHCLRSDVFLKYSGIKLPDSRNSTFRDERMPLADCEALCSVNCSCTAYTQLDIGEAVSGCLFYHGDLFDIRTLSQGGQDLYIRLASAELDIAAADSKGKNRVTLIAGLASVAGVVLIVVCLGLILIFTRKKNPIATRKQGGGPFSENPVKETDLQFLNLSTILEATDNFSVSNKLGQGGFGPVYKGKLEDGQEIAVKRLSKTSSQGVDELKNEVALIAKLQHRNLVRLLGCCIEGEENMLIYEYMPNNSLDLMLFDQAKSVLRDWGRRFNIINGISKGLLYLHQDSRLRIIHRDLKASNILLDADMNPKISDFGLARSFGGNETEAQTHRVVGTYGYMSPEYAIDGLFSIKSDVFSFGVLMLEIVSGKRNRGFSLKEHSLNLLGHAWTLYKEDNSRQLVDASLEEDSMDLSQALRSIHVGLLCVQKSAEDRPSMSSVVFMLGNEVALPQAKEPGFFTERDVHVGNNAHSSKTSNAINSENQVTITLLQGR